MYVSAGTQGLIASMTGATGPETTQGYTLEPGVKATASSPATCTAKAADGSYSCTIYFSLSPAASPYTVTLTAYDAPQSGASETPTPKSSSSTAIALSTDTETLTIVAGQSNTVTFTLHGIVQAFDTMPHYIGVEASPGPTSSPAVATFGALDGDDYFIGSSTDATSFFVGPQPSGTFEPALFTASVLDAPKSSANEDVAACGSAPCIALTTASPSVTNAATESVAFTYNGTGAAGDGKAVQPYYGVVALSEPAGYSGTTSAMLGMQSNALTSYAATAYVVPFFGFSDPTSSFTTDPTHVTFAASGNSVTLYAAQFHLPDGSSGYSESDDCGTGSSAIATTSALTANPGYGANLALTAGSTSGSCTVTLSDGATPADTAQISVSNTSGSGSGMLSLVQSASLTFAHGDANGDVAATPTFTLSAPPKAGDLLIASISYAAYNALFEEMVGTPSAQPGWTIALNQTTNPSSWNLFAYHIVTASDDESQNPISVPHGYVFIGEINEISGAGSSPTVSTVGANSPVSTSVTVSTTSMAANTLAFVVSSQYDQGGASPTVTNFNTQFTTNYAGYVALMGVSNGIYANGADVTATVSYPQPGEYEGESAAILLLAPGTDMMSQGARSRKTLRQQHSPPSSHANLIK